MSPNKAIKRLQERLDWVTARAAIRKTLEQAAARDDSEAAALKCAIDALGEKRKENVRMSNLIAELRKHNRKLMQDKIDLEVRLQVLEKTAK